jgi:MarR family transcriptional regulator, temperature-dependent positive regulator of motility
MAVSQVSAAEPAEGPTLEQRRMDDLTHAKLWRNPCWFSARFNYIGWRFNTPAYDWVDKRFGLSRAELGTLYNLALVDGLTATEIAVSSGIPKMNMSRAVARLAKLKMIVRAVDEADRRGFVLRLTAAGRAVVDEVIPKFKALEEEMLDSLSTYEREMLSTLLAKVVLNMLRAHPQAEEGV